MELQFVSSPTIRVNRRDIQLNGQESNCEACGSSSDVSTDFRVWKYKGQQYNAAPKTMIIEALLQEVYGGTQKNTNDHPVIREVPDNLKRFFQAKEENTPARAALSCGCS